jgi:hypothetical protein
LFESVAENACEAFSTDRIIFYEHHCSLIRDQCSGKRLRASKLVPPVTAAVVVLAQFGNPGGPATEPKSKDPAFNRAFVQGLSFRDRPWKIFRLLACCGYHDERARRFANLPG